MSRSHDFYFSSIIIMIVMLSSSGEENYCGICSDHSMCLYKNEKPNCDSKSYGLTPEEQDEIVDVHNKYRQRVASGNETGGKPGPQPPAKNMPNLIWDEELATVAQRWANQCQFAHDKCRAVKRFPVGQNIAQISTIGSDPPGLEKLISLWYDEVDLFDSKQVSNVTNFDEVGHYTQMLWADTTKIGCGFVNYFRGKEIVFHLVCNYGPTGNWMNEMMYEPISNRLMTNQQKFLNNSEKVDSIHSTRIIENQFSVELKKFEPTNSKKIVNQQIIPKDLEAVVTHASNISIPIIYKIISIGKDV